MANICKLFNKSCNCENCPQNVVCPLDHDVKNEKDKSISRNRHHNKEKEKSAARKNAHIIAAKEDKLPYSATPEQFARAFRRTYNAMRKVH